MNPIKSTNTYKLFNHLVIYRKLIAAMAVHEVRSRYVGSIGGAFWLLIHPLITASIYWFIFSVGFKVLPHGDIPFILFFLAGLAPWLTFQEITTNSAECVVRSPHLVKKVVFPLEVLPIIYLLVGLVPQAAMILFLMCGVLYFHMDWSWAFLSGFYYLFALMFFTLGLGWLFSSINVFFRDVSQGLAVGLGLWFWLTPIVWPLELLPEQYRFWLTLNPVYYIVEGYRDSFLYGIPFWQSGNGHLYFWLFSLCLFLLGRTVFKRLQGDFAEVL